jgi:predicted Zn-dependent protease
LGSPEAREAAGRLIAHAGEPALAHVVHERSLMLRFAANRPTQATAIDDLTAELAVIRKGQMGRAATNSGEAAALAGCAERAQAAAEAAASRGAGALEGFAPVGALAGGIEGAHDAGTAELDAGAGGAALAGVFEVAAAAGLEAHGIWTVAEQTRAVMDHESDLYERTTDAFMKVICIDPHTGRSGFAAATARAAADLHPLVLCEQALHRAALQGEPAELAPGEYPVLFAPHAVGTLLGLLASSALNGLAHAEGRGALAGRLGHQVASPSINLADSPAYPLTLPRAFDAEGVAKRPLPLIQDGVARGVVHDTRSAALAGTASTGHALAPGGAPDGPLPTNLVLAGGGAADAEELCAPVERGIYVTRLWYPNVVRPKETLVTAVTRDGTFLIENGHITRPLRDLRLTDSVLGILARTQALGAEQQLVSEGEFYGRRFACGVVCPALRARAVRFTGRGG